MKRILTVMMALALSYFAGCKAAPVRSGDSAPTPAAISGMTASEFEPVAAKYRSLPAKPELPENARRYKVQAEAAVAERRYDAAMALFNKGLEIAPWWPEGHFNLAMLWADRGSYPNAINEMKKYIALVPNAPDARAAQDKIYEWEGKAEVSNSPEPTGNK